MTSKSKIVVLLFVLTASTPACAQSVNYDIRNFGARCDGSDDSGAINAALQSVPDGGTVTIPCQASVGSSGIVLHGKRGVTVMGVGVGSGFKSAAITNLGVQGFGPVLFAVKFCSGCVVRDLLFEQNNLALSAIGFDRCNAATAQNLVIRNVAYPANAGLAAVGNVSNRYVGNTVTDTGHGAVDASGVPNDGVRGLWIGNFRQNEIEWSPTISGNIVQRTGATGIGVHANNAIVTGNLVEDTLGAGIKVEPDGKPVLANNVDAVSLIQGNTARRNLFHGVQIESSAFPAVIEGNLLERNRIAGVYVSGSSFVNSKIVNNVLTENREAGIYIYSGNSVLIQGNQITDTTSVQKSGVVLESLGPAAIANLQITGNAIAGTQVSGISLLARGGNLEAINLSSNSVTNGRMYGVVVDATNGATAGINWGSNCFAGLQLGIVADSRGFLTPPGQTISSYCK